MLLVKSKELKSSNRALNVFSHVRNWIWLFCFYLAWPILSFAQDSPTSSASATQATPMNVTSATPLDSASSWISVLFSLFLVIGVIVGLGYVMKRFNVTKTGSGQLQIVASMMAGPRERIMVVQIGSEQHVIGVTAHNINHLAKLEQPLSIEQPGEVFRNKFNELLQKPNDTKQPE